MIAVLDGRALPARRTSHATSGALPEPLTGGTRLPPGQRCTQQLRHFFVHAVGSGFRFDESMRTFIRRGGAYLDEAVAHWHRTRAGPEREIAPQFELNRFIRSWHRDHPGGTGAAARDAWRRHRALPIDAR